MTVVLAFLVAVAPATTASASDGGGGDWGPFCRESSESIIYCSVSDVVLGYQDDGYSDNGYYAHDDGTQDQCRNSVNAWVHLEVRYP